MHVFRHDFRLELGAEDRTPRSLIYTRLLGPFTARFSRPPPLLSAIPAPFRHFGTFSPSLRVSVISVPFGLSVSGRRCFALVSRLAVSEKGVCVLSFPFMHRNISLYLRGLFSIGTVVARQDCADLNNTAMPLLGFS